MSVTKTIDISVLPEAEQDLIKALFDKCCERAKPKEKTNSGSKVWKPKYGEDIITLMVADLFIVQYGLIALSITVDGY